MSCRHPKKSGSCDQLFQAMRDDQVAEFINSNHELLLGPPTEVD